MDGLIILAVILLVARGVAMRAKEIRQAASNEATRTAEKTRARQMSARVTPPPKKTEVRADLSIEEGATSSEGMARHSTIQSTLLRNNVMQGYNGSLGGAGKEGQTLGEGDRPRGSSLVQSLRQPVKPSVKPSLANHTQVLPQTLDGNTLVQAFVMSEIINRPRKWGR